MEILRRGAWITDLHVVFCAQAQKAIHPAVGMLRPLALVAMRQQKHQIAGLTPFRFRAGDKVIDDYLSAVGKVSELSLPEDQRERVRHAIAKLETQDCRLRKGAVEHLEAGLISLQVVQGYELLAAFQITENQVSLAERAARAILAAQSNWSSLADQCAEGQRLGIGPVNIGLAFHKFAPFGQEGLQLGM